MTSHGKQLNTVRSKDKAAKTVFGTALFLFLVVCAELFRRMAVSYQGMFGTYYSDINVRLEMRDGSNTYSLFLIPEYFFADHVNEPFGTFLIGVYLSLFTAGTVILLYLFLKQLCPDSGNGVLLFMSFVCMLSVPIVVAPLSEKIFSPYAGAVWHNETYIGMRFVALLILIYFFKTCGTYMERFSLKGFIVSSLLFLAVNWIKPNFIIAFAPAMLVMMIIDIIKAKGKGFVNWMLYGIPVLIGLLVLPFQFSSLFTETNAVNADNNAGIAFILGDFILEQKHPVFNIIFAFAFPALMFILHRKEVVRSKFHLVCCLGWFLAFLEYAFLSETGWRRGHENFYWGVRFFSLVLFCLSVGFFIKDYQKNKALYGKPKDKDNRDKKKIHFNMFFVETLLLAAHFFSGIFYFLLVLLGSRASAL